VIFFFFSDRISLLVVLIPAAVVSVAVLLIGVILWTVWRFSSRNRKYSAYHRWENASETSHTFI